MKTTPFYILTIFDNPTRYRVYTVLKKAESAAESYSAFYRVILKKLVTPPNRKTQAELTQTLLNREDINPHTEHLKTYESKAIPNQAAPSGDASPAPSRPVPTPGHRQPAKPAKPANRANDVPLEELHGDVYNKRAFDETVKARKEEAGHQISPERDPLRNPPGYKRARQS